VKPSEYVRHLSIRGLEG